jgi:hypothetical protein
LWMSVNLCFSLLFSKLFLLQKHFYVCSTFWKTRRKNLVLDVCFSFETKLQKIYGRKKIVWSFSPMELYRVVIFLQYFSPNVFGSSPTPSFLLLCRIDLSSNLFSLFFLVLLLSWIDFLEKGNSNVLTLWVENRLSCSVVLPLSFHSIE